MAAPPVDGLVLRQMATLLRHGHSDLDALALVEAGLEDGPELRAVMAARASLEQGQPAEGDDLTRLLGSGSARPDVLEMVADVTAIRSGSRRNLRFVQALVLGSVGGALVLLTFLTWALPLPDTAELAGVRVLQVLARGLLPMALLIFVLTWRNVSHRLLGAHLAVDRACELVQALGRGDEVLSRLTLPESRLLGLASSPEAALHLLSSQLLVEGRRERERVLALLPLLILFCGLAGAGLVIVLNIVSLS